MGIWFEIEDLVRRRGRAYLTVRMIEPQSFSLCGQHTLGGAEIEPWIGRPRAHDGEGKGGGDLFSFVLRDPSALSEFEVGERVELRRGGAGHWPRSCV